MNETTETLEAKRASAGISSPAPPSYRIPERNFPAPSPPGPSRAGCKPPVRLLECARA